MPLKIKSYAKINLCLYLLGKRKDGFHEILTVMQMIDLCDGLTLSKIPRGIEIECDHPKVSLDSSNLACQAAQALLKEARLNCGVKIKIEKKIPLASGLGGGSSNAAFTLIGLNQLFHLRFSQEKLHKIAEKIGSDVPFFLYSGQAVAYGRGEKIKEIFMPKDYWIVLIKPNFELSTKEIYQKSKINLTKKGFFIKIYQDENGFFDELRVWENDLEGIVIKGYPQIEQAKKTLQEKGAIKVSLSGSGPTVYGIFKSKPTNKEVEGLKRGDWQIFLTRPIPPVVG
jgi:4-diphosphocytidyl-2-C-methyl-D-erythritol kinase